MRRVLTACLGLLGACDGAAPDAPTDAHADAPTIRVATFNAYLNRPEEGRLIADLSTPDDAQARAVAEIIQRVAPDIVLLQEFDHDALGRAVALFQANYLAVGQNGAAPVSYPYVYAGPVNTGLASGHDLDRDGSASSAPGTPAYAGDAFGYGAFPGQYGMALLSKHPIDAAGVRSFQKFLWKDMPGARLPDDAATAAPSDWYSAAALADMRLSSKSHWDIPVDVGGRSLHVLVAHPTPPVFDGPEDRNGLRNHDEIRLIADYVTPGAAGYLYDDSGARGGLEAGARFVILGDFNADPFDGDGVPGAIAQLLGAAAVNADIVPQSAGAAAAAAQGGANLSQRGPAAADTSDFDDDPARRGPGNLRLDYALPSKAGLAVAGSGVFWPAPDEPHYALVGPGWPVASSDHRLVWVDLQLTE